jgi:hypothetical protein
MVNNCANPVCRDAFKLLDSGDLYALERQAENTEFYWLCPERALRFQLHLNARGGIVPKLRGEKGHADSPRPDASLRLVARTVQQMQDTQEGERPVLESSIPNTTRCSLRLHSF